MKDFTIFVIALSLSILNYFVASSVFRWTDWKLNSCMRGGWVRTISHGSRMNGGCGRKRRKRYKQRRGLHCFHPFRSLASYWLSTSPTPAFNLHHIQVIRYQKQLQQNYILMYRRNRDLERVMRELSVELESRDTDDYEVRSGSNDIHFEEITATEIWERTDSQSLAPCTKTSLEIKNSEREQRAGPNTALPWRWSDLNRAATLAVHHCPKKGRFPKRCILTFLLMCTPLNHFIASSDLKKKKKRFLFC